MTTPTTEAWRRVGEPVALNGFVDQVLKSVDTLRGAWKEVVALASPEEFAEARKRSLRRHAIETGIIERLYDVEWGVTQALVAEGLTAEVAAREGDLSDDALAIIRSQYDALEFLSEHARAGRPLSIHFVRELHQLICGRQQVYDGHDALGRRVQVPLTLGEWKTNPNHVRRPDGSLLEYTPPEHVQSEMENLLENFRRGERLHPVHRAAWLHHAFISIHPFADGNGRVARALTLLVLLQQHYAPLVVERTQRTPYIAALDKANGGDLRDLVLLFAGMEIVALRSELERPTRAVDVADGAVEVARSSVRRLRTLRAQHDAGKAAAANVLASALIRRITEYLTTVSDAIRQDFADLDPGSDIAVYTAMPPQEQATYWRAQIIRTANRADFFVNLREGAWWSHLRIRIAGQTMRYVAVVQKVGHGETGVLALTVFAEAISEVLAGDRPSALSLIESTAAETATFVYGDDPDARWDDVCGLLDRTLAASIATFTQSLD
ncbi:MAG: Fic family protein [Pseudonocardia sp.]|nr:Fic family protein [Pseudonocardia sp.]